MNDKQVKLVEKLESVMKDIIRKSMQEDGLEIADIVYCSVFVGEELALRTKREQNKQLKK